MKITPIEIRQKVFERVFRGYEKESVDAFLLSLSQEWERVMEENKDLRKKLEVTEKEVIRLRDVENSLFRTLKTAEDAGAHILDSANKTAELHVREAQMDAEALLNEARNKARSIMEDAEEDAKEITGNLKEEIKVMERNYCHLLDEKESLLLDLHHMVSDFNEKIKKYSENYSTKEAEINFKNAKKISLQKLKDNISDTTPRDTPKESSSKSENHYHTPISVPPIEEAKVIITPPPSNPAPEEPKSTETDPNKSFFDNI